MNSVKSVVIIVLGLLYCLAFWLLQQLKRSASEVEPVHRQPELQRMRQRKVRTRQGHLSARPIADLVDEFDRVPEPPNVIGVVVGEDHYVWGERGRPTAGLLCFADIHDRSDPGATP